MPRRTKTQRASELRRSSVDVDTVVEPVMPAPVEVFQLPDRLDHSAAGMLAKQFLEKRGADLIVDASSVEVFGAQCLQVLISASRTWMADGWRMTLNERSPLFDEPIRLLGAELESLFAGERVQ